MIPLLFAIGSAFMFYACVMDCFVWNMNRNKAGIAYFAEGMFWVFVLCVSTYAILLDGGLT